MSVFHVTNENFEELKRADRPVLLDFFATWCGPCRMIAPFVEEIAAEHPEYIIAKIDVDECTDLAREFGIESIPTLVVLKDGKPVKTAMGARPKDAILALLQD